MCLHVCVQLFFTWNNMQLISQLISQLHVCKLDQLTCWSVNSLLKCAEICKLYRNFSDKYLAKMHDYPTFGNKSNWKDKISVGPPPPHHHHHHQIISNKRTKHQQDFNASITLSILEYLSVSSRENETHSAPLTPRTPCPPAQVTIVPNPWMISGSL